jgi:hypothetical protein
MGKDGGRKAIDVPFKTNKNCKKREEERKHGSLPFPTLRGEGEGSHLEEVKSLTHN